MALELSGPQPPAVLGVGRNRREVDQLRTIRQVRLPIVILAFQATKIHQQFFGSR